MILVIMNNVICNGFIVFVGKRPNDPIATRPARAFDCNLDAMAGFAAAHVGPPGHLLRLKYLE